MIRINKWLSEMGVCSKKQADRMIEAGEVLVDGKLARLGMKLLGDEKVTVNGKLIEYKPEEVFLLYNKPVGVECTHDIAKPASLDNHLDFPARVFAVGRLDKDSEGLLLLTNQGDVVNKLMRAENKHSKTYRVWVDKTLTPRFLTEMASGVEILDTKTLPCEVRMLNDNCFEIKLVQGLNRQIRRMCKTLGYRVTRLQRTHIMEFDLSSLDEGQFRKLKAKEVQVLLAALQNSKNQFNS